MIDENLCNGCGHKDKDYGGWCYMFKDKPGSCTRWLPSHLEKAEARAKLCLEACADMSDEEVKTLPTFQATTLTALTENNECLAFARDQIISLKAQIVEAKKVIRELQSVAGQSSPYHNDLANGFLNRKGA